MELLGHSQMRTTTDIYSHVMPALAREAAERMAAVLLSQSPQLQPKLHRPSRQVILGLTFPQVKRGGAEGTRTPDPHTASPSCRDSRTCADEQSACRRRVLSHQRMSANDVARDRRLPDWLPGDLVARRRPVVFAGEGICLVDIAPPPSPAAIVAAYAALHEVVDRLRASLEPARTASALT